MSVIELKALGQFAACLESLYRATDLAGGSISTKDLQNMSGLELISTLASNNVRFVYQKDAEPNGT